MKAKTRILCLSFWTPPLVRPRAVLIGKIIPEWLRQGMEPVILAYKKAERWDIPAPLYEISEFKISKFLHKISLVRGLLRKIYFEKIFKIAAQIIKKHELNLVFSFANPQDSNILGAMLKKKLGIKFISHFSDPWYGNPYNSFSQRVAKKILKLEKFVIRESDRVIFTNEEARDLVMRKYPPRWQKKVRIIPPCYDPNDYSAIAKRDAKEFIFSYIGAFYEQRSPEMFFSALSKMLAENEDLRFKVKVRLVGAVSSYSGYSEKHLREAIKRYNLEKIVEIIASVEHRRSLAYMKMSDCLIVIDADFRPSPFLPSKLIDYAASQVPIIGITPSGSPTDNFLKNLGCRSFNYSQGEELKNYLEGLISNKEKVNINKEFLKKFEVSYVVSQQLKEFNEVMQNN